MSADARIPVVGLKRSSLSEVRDWLSSANFWSWVAVCLGVLFRLTEYLQWRQAYMDENSLLRNLVEMDVLDLHTTLVEDQLAAPGFLILERLLVRLPGEDIFVTRLLPLACGIISVFLMRTAARRYLSERAVPLAVALFGLADWLIYYATELKQYSSDVMLTLLALIVAVQPRLPAEIGTRGWTPYRYLAVLGVGAIGIWFSQPLIFVLPGVGLYLLSNAVAAKDWQRVRFLSLIGVSWLASFAASFGIAQRIVSKRSFLWEWWNFAFLRIPPRSVGELQTDFLQIINMLISPGGVETPLGMIPSAYCAAGLFLAGCWSFGRRRPGGLLLLLSPIVLTITASALYLYPFHGRLLLFLVPCVHLIVTQGAIAVSWRGGLIASVTLSLFLLLQPINDLAWAQFLSKRTRGEFDTHGDLSPDLLDYLDQRARRGKNPMRNP